MNKVTPKISIILPVYNVADYLRQCLDSAVNQTLKDIEIICVNDGSTDNSPQILEEYAKKDARIKVINQQNAGQGAARNNGLQHASAPYVYFADSDDWLDLTMAEKLYDKMSETDADVCLLGVHAYDESLHKVVCNSWLEKSFFAQRPQEVCSPLEIKRYIFARWAPFFRIQKTEFLRRNNILFPLNVQYEDAFFHLQCMILAQKITFCDENLYYYHINRPNSTMVMTSLNRYSFFIYTFLQSFYDFLHAQNLYETLLVEYLQCFLGQVKYHLNIIADVFRIEFVDTAQKFIKEHNFETQINSIQQLAAEWKSILQKQYKVSIIVPIYNVEKYLEKCLESIINQTLKPIEIICVDDGSTDTSPQILAKFAARDNRIKVITQKNAGLPDARNAGLDIAKAEYIMFADSDDYLADNMMELLYNAIIKYKTDTAVCDVENVSDDTLAAAKQISEKQKYDTWFDRFRLSDGIYDVDLNISRQLASVCWNKIYKTDIIRQYNMRFPEKLFQEDEFWLWEYMLQCKNFYFVNKKLYTYMHRQGSHIDIFYKSVGALDILEQCKNIYNYVKKYKDITPYKPLLAQYFIASASNRLQNTDTDRHPALLEKVRDYTFNCNPSEMMLNFYHQIKKQITTQG